MAFDTLNKGDKVDVHLFLYENELRIIDALAERYQCSRAAVVGQMAVEMSRINLTGKVPEAKTEGKRARRRAQKGE